MNEDEIIIFDPLGELKKLVEEISKESGKDRKR